MRTVKEKHGAQLAAVTREVGGGERDPGAQEVRGASAPVPKNRASGRLLSEGLPSASPFLLVRLFRLKTVGLVSVFPEPPPSAHRASFRAILFLILVVVLWKQDLGYSFHR